MSEQLSLAGFVPAERQGSRVDLQNDLAGVVTRLAEVLPNDKVWEYFSSTPGETGGRIMFPYCRVDSALIIARDRVWMGNNLKLSSEDFAENYRKASLEAFRALTWVEIGFQGLPNLAVSPASRNWTSAIGHLVNDEQRAQRIVVEGKKIYEGFLGKFAEFRTRHNLSEDYFTQYGVEHLLERFRE